MVVKLGGDPVSDALGEVVRGGGRTGSFLRGEPYQLESPLLLLPSLGLVPPVGRAMGVGMEGWEWATHRLWRWRLSAN